MIYYLFVDHNSSDYDNTDDDDDICYICDHRDVNNGTMELLIVWTKGKREWSNIKNVKKYCPNLVDKYIRIKGLNLNHQKGREFY